MPEWLTNPPAWLVTAFTQYPIAAMNLLVVWAWRQIAGQEHALNQRADQLRKETRETGEKETERLRQILTAAHQEYVATRDREVECLNQGLVDEVKKLAKKVDDLTKKLG